MIWHTSKVDAASARLFLLSDVHYESREFDSGLLSRWISEVKGDPAAKWIGLGDYFDAATKVSPTSPFGQRMTLDDAIAEMIERLRPIADKCIVIIPGNHDFRPVKFGGGCPARSLATALNVPYEADAARVRVKVNLRSCGKRYRQVYKVYGIHGCRGGRSLGGKANGLADLALVEDADIYAQGHTHQSVVTYNMVQGKRRALVNNASFLSGESGYGIKAGYVPLDTQWPVIHLDGNQHRVKVEL